VASPDWLSKSRHRPPPQEREEAIDPNKIVVPETDNGDAAAAYAAIAREAGLHSSSDSSSRSDSGEDSEGYAGTEGQRLHLPQSLEHLPTGGKRASGRGGGSRKKKTKQ